MADIPSLLSEGPENKCKALRDVVRGVSAMVGAGLALSCLQTGVPGGSWLQCFHLPFFPPLPLPFFHFGLMGLPLFFEHVEKA
jgi:hypothetical protein